MEKRFYSTTEVADIFRVNRVTIYRWIKEGKIDAYEIGKHFKVPEKEIRRLVRKFGISGDLLQEIQERLAAGQGFPAGESLPGDRMQRKLVVAVSADPTFQACLKDTFNGRGSNSLEAELVQRWRLMTFPDSLAAALEIGREKPDLLLLDGSAPGLDGADFAKKVRSIVGRVPVIFIAAEPVKYSQQYLNKLVQAGVTVVGRALDRDVIRGILSDSMDGDRELNSLL